MSPSNTRLILSFFSMNLFFSTNVHATVPIESTNLLKSASLVGAAAKTVKETVGRKADTLIDVQDTSVIARDTVAANKDTLDIIMSTEGMNTIPGFRVQIGSTQDLSAAVAERAKAETLLTNYNVYIIYDSPYYKVRAGDFRARYDATQAANFISSHGFSEAWVVPDNVFKNPMDGRKGNR